MKKLILLILAVGLLTGCAWTGPVENNPMNRGFAYTGGRGSGAVLYSLLSENIRTALQNRYQKFLDETKDQLVIKPELTIALANDLASIMVTEVNDPYYILSDLTYFLGMFGAQYVGEGDAQKLVAVESIPRIMFMDFAKGWDLSILMMRAQEDK